MADPQALIGEVETGGPFGWLKARAGRREFWTQAAIVVVISFALTFTPIFQIRQAAVLALLLTTPRLVLMLLQIRRVHDFGRSGWWAAAATIAPMVLIVPVMAVSSPGVASATGIFFELLLLVAIGALPGDPEDNRFGPPPPFTARRVLTGR